MGAGPAAEEGAADIEIIVGVDRAAYGLAAYALTAASAEERS